MSAITDATGGPPRTPQRSSSFDSLYRDGESAVHRSPVSPRLAALDLLTWPKKWNFLCDDSKNSTFCSHCEKYKVLSPESLQNTGDLHCVLPLNVVASANKWLTLQTEEVRLFVISSSLR